MRGKRAFSRPSGQIQFKPPHINPPKGQRHRLNMHIPGQEPILCKISAKNLILGYSADSGPILRDKCSFSRHSQRNRVKLLHDNPPKGHRNRLNMHIPGQNPVLCTISAKNLIWRYSADSGTILRDKCSFSRPSGQIQFKPPDINPPKGRRSRLNMHIPGQEPVLCKISAKNLILRRLTEIGAFWETTTRSLGRACQLVSIDCISLFIRTTGSEWIWVLCVWTLCLTRYASP